MLELFGIVCCPLLPQIVRAAPALPLSRSSPARVATFATLAFLSRSAGAFKSSAAVRQRVVAGVSSHDHGRDTLACHAESRPIDARPKSHQKWRSNHPPAVPADSQLAHISLLTHL